MYAQYAMYGILLGLVVVILGVALALYSWGQHYRTRKHRLLGNVAVCCIIGGLVLFTLCLMMWVVDADQQNTRTTLLSSFLFPHTNRPQYRCSLCEREGHYLL